MSPRKSSARQQAASALLPEIRRRSSGPAGLIRQQDRENWKLWADKQAQDCFSKGQDCWKQGDVPGALGWLERSHRMAPDSPNVALLLAVVRQHCGLNPQAIELLTQLTGKHDCREGQAHLAAALFAGGRLEEALAALSKALSRNVCTDNLAALADQITGAAGLPAWCGLWSDGAIRLGGHGLPAHLTSLHVKADGHTCKTRASGRNKLTMHGLSAPARMLSISAGAVPLTGSPLQPAHALRVEGLAETGPAGLTGWVWHPSDPDHPPLLRILDARTGKEIQSLVAEQFSSAVSSDIPLARYRSFSVPWHELPEGPVRVVTETGHDLSGSPLDPTLERRSARQALEQAHDWSLNGSLNTLAALPFHPLPAGTVFSAPQVSPAYESGTRPDILVIVPVYRDTDCTEACLNSLLATLSPTSRKALPSIRILIVNDQSPDPQMAPLLEKIARHPAVTLCTTPHNLGFPGAVNTGLRLALAGGKPGTRRKAGQPADVILLNSDTLVAGEWLEELNSVAWSAPDIGTVTPLSNDATIMSYPDIHRNTVPDLQQTRRMMKLARTACAGTAVDVPTAHGFCMYIRHDCLQQTGLLRDDLFAQGYGEENDFSLRARAGGWRNVAAPGAYVAHVGSASFGGTRHALQVRNLSILNRLYPGYDALIAGWAEQDPLFTARRKIDMLRWRMDGLAVASSKTDQQSVLMVTHDYGGGVERVVRERASQFQKNGIRPVLIRPVEGGCLIEGWRDTAAFAPGKPDRDGNATGFYPSMRFRLPEEWPRLLQLLRTQHPRHLEWHHASGHHMRMRELAATLKVPYDVWVHDYIWFCPRISLTGPNGWYCGEPPPEECERCLAVQGRSVDDDLPVVDYIRRSAEELRSARRVITPSDDTARRMARHFPDVTFHPAPLEDDRPGLTLEQLSAISVSADKPLPAPGKLPQPDRYRVCIVGAIGREKGYEVLLEAARDAQKKALPLDFIIVGHTPDDLALMETGHVYITGEYKNDEAVALIRAQRAHYGLIPSVWPETWCLALSIAWKAGLPVAAFDFGAVAERIRITERGTILPPGISADRLNVILMSLCQRQAENRGTGLSGVG